MATPFHPIKPTFGWGIWRIFAHREAVSDWLTKLAFNFTSARSTIGCWPHRFRRGGGSGWDPGAEPVVMVSEVRTDHITTESVTDTLRMFIMHSVESRDDHVPSWGRSGCKILGRCRNDDTRSKSSKARLHFCAPSAQAEKCLLWHPQWDNKFVVGGGSQMTMYEWAPEKFLT
ncbi:hypothetical protein K503DRAFT_787918 [Rhizopogon vinicolor AM-OR11-026]|uniref:Uncharacterized protein n=1 Tax=Rhizopogon vinicolor AM-OR11-026 TaxID=1314800 RepID=A0A1B7MFD1_9AGAM|nr:hypothetical protein K503DRAFT_787918 [Rhizopogon vinicolor AM-OR11-026]